MDICSQSNSLNTRCKDETFMQKIQSAMKVLQRRGDRRRAVSLSTYPDSFPFEGGSWIYSQGDLLDGDMDSILLSPILCDVTRFGWAGLRLVYYSRERERRATLSGILPFKSAFDGGSVHQICWFQFFVWKLIIRTLTPILIAYFILWGRSNKVQSSPYHHFGVESSFMGATVSRPTFI